MHTQVHLNILLDIILVLKQIIVYPLSLHQETLLEVKRKGQEGTKAYQSSRW